MKDRLMSLLACPHCRQNLRLTPFKRIKHRYSKAAEKKAVPYCRRKKIPFPQFVNATQEGILSCACGRWFPIIDGIARLLSDDLVADVAQRHGSFFEKYHDRLPKKLGGRALEKTSMQRKTGRSFGFQWNTFSEMQPQYRQNFLNYIHPLQADFFKGKLVLDAGSGTGRHSFYAAEFGAETLAMDLSEAVCTSQRNLSEFPLSHVIQADIYHPPVQKCFDFIFSIGVLHHLPDPQGGFNSLVKLMKKGTQIFAWVYGKEGRAFKTAVMEQIHAGAKHVPHHALYYGSYLPAALYHAINQVDRAMEKSGWKRASEKMPFHHYAQYPFRVKHADTFDFLSTQVNNYYTYDEFKKWFTDAHLKNIQITSLKGRSWRGFGIK